MNGGGEVISSFAITITAEIGNSETDLRQSNFQLSINSRMNKVSL